MARRKEYRYLLRTSGPISLESLKNQLLKDHQGTGGLIAIEEVSLDHPGTGGNVAKDHPGTGGNVAKDHPGPGGLVARKRRRRR